MAFTFTAENGSGLSNANSYYTIEAIDAELENFDDTEWQKGS